jgi:hypothetical protein
LNFQPHNGLKKSPSTTEFFMKDLQVTARVGGKGGTAHTVDLPFAETLEELIEQFGETAVYANARSNIVVGLQGFVRSKVNAKVPLTGDDLQKAAEEWKPGERTSGVSKVEKLKERLSALSEEDKAELLEAMGMAPAATPAAAKPAAKPPAGKPAATTAKRR